MKIEFDPSTFVVNGKTWTIDETGRIGNSVIKYQPPASWCYGKATRK
ncbi:MAG: hypothetical protein WDN26_19585 [Chitinophagaceae bacterium]